MEDLIKLRQDLQIKLINFQGANYFMLNCLHGLSPQPVLIHASLSGFLRDLLEGIPRERLETILNQDPHYVLEGLRKNFLLDNKEYQELKAAQARNFRDSPVREACFAGILYPADPNERRLYVKTLLNRLETQSLQLSNPDVVIFPHIDYARGAIVYAQALNVIKEVSAKRLVILIGTDHKPSSRLFTVLNKDMSLPGKLFRVSKNALQKLERDVGYSIYKNLLNHKTEHSLELALPFLEFLWHDNLEILPIIVSSFDNFRKYDDLKNNTEFNSFTSSLKNLITNLSETLIVLCIDFSHLGREFGDPFTINEIASEETKKFDFNLQEEFSKCRPQSLFDGFISLNFRQKVCGFSSLVTIAELISSFSSRIELIHNFYNQAKKPESLVSFFGTVSKFQT